VREVSCHHKIRPKVLTLTVLVLALASFTAAGQEAVMSELSGIRQEAVDAYNQRSWTQAATAADRYLQLLEANDLPRAGSDFALVSFIGGHSRFEVWKADPEAFSYDFGEDVLGAMKASLKILQDDPFFKHNVLGSAFYEKLAHERFNDVELENSASWHLYRALMIRAEELQDEPRDSEKYEAFAKYVLHYINRCFKMARYSQVPQIYRIRVREACRLGFGTRFDDRFAQLYKVVGFDDGNVRAGVLWQIGLDLMNGSEPDPEEVLETFVEAARATKGIKQRAEIYRQMADYCSRQDDHGYKLKAVEYGRMAFKLDPSSEDIQVQYGTSLHVVSYAHYTSGRYREALKVAREATSFQWDGDELAYFDLSRAQANFGNKIKAITHAEKAYKIALKKYGEEELQPFRQNYANILRQFGLAKKAEELERNGQGS
jgi:hypothetical protein